MKTNIIIHNNFPLPLDAGMLAACLAKIVQYVPEQGENDVAIGIYTKPRDYRGWLEWGIVTNDIEPHRGLYIACIQRKPNAEYEFCS